MIHLINNHCVKLVDIDEEGGGQTGEIYFSGGEEYSGEIVNQVPSGQGTLRMNDGSYFKGNFDGKSMTYGQFVHFTGIIVKGHFNRDRLSKGKVIFTDGEVLIGEWGIKKNRWVLKKGVLLDGDKKEIQNFTNSSDYVKSQLKEIFADDQQNGFLIKIQHYYDFNGVPYSPMSISVDGYAEYSLINKQKEEKINNVVNYQMIPYHYQEFYQNDILIKQFYQLSFGFNLIFEKENRDKLWTLTFKCLDGIYGKGDFEFSKAKLYFKGHFFLKKNEKIQLSLEITKTILGGLKIKCGNEIFSSLETLIDFLKNSHEEVIKLELVKSRKKSEIGKPVMKELISDIKKECIIF